MSDAEAEGALRDVFGDSDSDDDVPPEAPKQSLEDAGDGDDDAGNNAGSTGFELAERDDDDDGMDVDVPEEKPRGPPLHIEAPLLPPCDTEAELSTVKLSNILGVSTTPFDAETFEPEEGTFEDEHGNQRIKLRDANTIRWRWGVNEKGERVKESNARFVKWSDGSVQLLLGDEVLDVDGINTLRTEQSFLFVRHQGMIQCQGRLGKKMVFRPSSLESKTHKRLTGAVDMRHGKVNKVKQYRVNYDPEKRAEEEEKAARESDKLKRLQEKSKLKSLGGGTRKSNYWSAGGGLDEQYLENDDDDTERPDWDRHQNEAEAAREALRAGKRSRQMSADEEAAAEARLAKAKSGGASGSKRRSFEEEDDDDDDSDDDSDGGVEGGAISDDSDYGGKAKKRGRAMVLSDSDED